MLLEDRRGEIVKLHGDYRARLARHEIGIADLMKTETIQDSLDTYRKKIGDNSRNPAAAYELALKAERQYLAGDQISYYVTGRGARAAVNQFAKMAAEYDPDNPDENVEYYQAKLADLFEKFQVFVERPGLFAPAAQRRGQAGSALDVRRPANQARRTERGRPKSRGIVNST